jgi:hypothetical protein
LTLNCETIWIFQNYLEMESSKSKYNDYGKNLPKQQAYLSCCISNSKELKDFSMRTHSPRRDFNVIIPVKVLKKLFDSHDRLQRIPEIERPESRHNPEFGMCKINVIEGEEESSDEKEEEFEELFLQFILNEKAVVINHQLRHTFRKQVTLSGGAECFHCKKIFKGRHNLCHNCYHYVLAPLLLDTLKEDKKIALEGFDEFDEAQKKAFDE